MRTSRAETMTAALAVRMTTQEMTRGMLRSLRRKVRGSWGIHLTQGIGGPQYIVWLAVHTCAHVTGHLPP